MSVKDLPNQHRRILEPPSIDWLKTQLSYDPETGELRWLVMNQGRRSKVGSNNPDGYVYVGVTVEGVCHFMKRSRLAFALTVGRWPTIIDHINGDRTDDRWCNLREVNGSENQKNRRLETDNTWGIHGLVRRPSGKWEAAIRHSGAYLYLGRYSDFFEAVCARKSAELKYGFHENHGRS
jgi:hypothetical protein